jgi:transcriptional regulator NrdR family protein
MTFVINVAKNNENGKHQTEPFSRERLHNSIVAACLSVYTPEGQAETTADAVCDSVIIWLKQHPEVTSRDISITAAKQLKNYHPEAAYLYEQRHITI